MWDWCQSSLEWGHTVEVCKSLFAVLVLDYRQAYGQLGQGKGQLAGKRSGGNLGHSSSQALKQEVEAHHNGRAPNLLVYHSEAVHRILEEGGARHSGEEGCTGSHGCHRRPNGDHSLGSWQ